jgi:myo-inositol catabolism protein IolH
MKIALDPFMLRHLPARDVVRLAADQGYQYLEWSWREDFIPLLRRPRADRARILELRGALSETGVELVSLVALYRWASTDELERQAAVTYWRRAIEVALEVGCERLNTEFSGDPAAPAASEAAWTRSMEELLPTLEREGVTIDIEPHPGDFVEDSNVAADLVRSVGSPSIRYLFCAPHRFHLGSDLAEMIRYCAPVLTHVHVADTMNHLASSGLRFIVNPVDAPVRVHQHLNLGEGEVEWETFFGTLHEVGFDGVLTSAVFSREEHAVESSRQMLDSLRDWVGRYWGSPGEAAPTPEE